MAKKTFEIQKGNINRLEYIYVTCESLSIERDEYGRAYIVNADDTQIEFDTRIVGITALDAKGRKGEVIYQGSQNET